MTQNGIFVGLTGPSGAGKSSVSFLLQEKGYIVLDADVIAREVVQKGKKCLLDLVIAFGIEILNEDGTLNRRHLGEIVFGNAEKQKMLNSITFPYIQEAIFETAKQLKQQGNKVIFLDAPTLIESGTHKYCDKVVSVIAPAEERFIRILRRDNLTEEEIRNRMLSQHDDAFYISRSDFVIENTGDMNELRVRVMEMLDRIVPAS